MWQCVNYPWDIWGETLFFTIEKVEVQWGEEGVSAVEQLENLNEYELERCSCSEAEYTARAAHSVQCSSSVRSGVDNQYSDLRNTNITLLFNFKTGELNTKIWEKLIFLLRQGNICSSTWYIFKYEDIGFFCNLLFLWRILHCQEGKAVLDHSLFQNRTGFWIYQSKNMTSHKKFPFHEMGISLVLNCNIIDFLSYFSVCIIFS